MGRLMVGMATRKAHANMDGLLTDAYLRESVLERVQDGIERFRRSAREAFCVSQTEIDSSYQLFFSNT